MKKILNRANKSFNANFYTVILPGFVVYVILIAIYKVPYLANDWVTPIIPAILTSLVSWRNSVVLGNISFVRAENSKSKEIIVNYIDKLFDELNANLHDRRFVKNLEDYLTDRVTLLELRLREIKQRTGMTLLSPKKLSELRSLGLRLSKENDYSKLLSSSRFILLEEIEFNYSEFFNKENIR